MNQKFDDIRPYNEDEFPAAMQRIAHSEAFPLMASFVYPNDSLESVRQRICSFKSIREFQHDTKSLPVVQRNSQAPVSRS